MLDAWFGALAVELKDGGQARSLLARPAAAAMANALATELGRHLNGLDGLGLCWMAGCFDVAQLLRPGFPIHTELRQMYTSGVADPYGQPQVMTMSARGAQAPSPLLAPQAELAGGSLLYLPLVLVAEASRLALVRAQLEDQLLEQGLLDARSARMVIDALETPIEHARLLSCDDLCAITAANLQHAGLPSVWQVLETALFHPDRNVDLHSDEGLKWSVIGGVAHLHLSLTAALLQQELADLPGLLQRVRQALSLLNAHALPWRILPSSADTSIVIEQDDAGFWIEWCTEPGPFSVVTRVVDSNNSLLWLQLEDAQGRLLGCAVPLDRAGYEALRQRLTADGTNLAPQLKQLRDCS